MPRKFIYAVYDGDIEVFRGTSQQVTEKFDLCGTSPNEYFRRNMLIQRKYRVVVLGNAPHKERKEKARSLTKHEKELEYLVTHLRTYGNTIFPTEPKKYIKELNDLGINVRYRKVRDWDDDSYIKMRTKRQHYYILEVV